jgi:hypothetical protein
MSSIRRLISSRANAALSTGPKTAEGKRRSSQNALRHGCRSRRLAIPSDQSPRDLDNLRRSYLASVQPRTPFEHACLNQIVEAKWRISCLSSAENRMVDRALASQPPHLQNADSTTRLREAYLTLLDNPHFTVLSGYEYTQAMNFIRAIRSLLKSRRRKNRSIPTNEPTLFFPYASASPLPIPEHAIPARSSLDLMRYLTLLLFLATRALAQPVETQPFAAQVERLLEALDLLGAPLPAAETAELKTSTSVDRMQQILDRHVLVTIEINPESRVKATEGAATPELEQQGWRVFLVKVNNQAGTTPVLSVDSPNSGQLANAPEGAIQRKFLGLEMFNKQPLRAHLSGLAVEYRILSLFSRDAGQREARLNFDVGQGSQDLGFRSSVDLLFRCKPATAVKLHVQDFDDKPTTASFLIRDSQSRVYPSQAKRLAPDFFFQPQIYRADGETLALPPGDYTVEYTRGPEYRKTNRKFHVAEQPMTLDFHLDRWIDPAARGWYSGDHHVHAAGCAHYEKPSEGVYPQDMIRHIVGEDLKRGAVLTWGPGWYFQKTFFEGADNKLSTLANLMRYDVEVSGFPSSHTGHIVLLGLQQEDYPDTRRIEDWPSWGVPIFRWARKQGAVAGYAHSGWGLAVKTDALPTYEIPPFDGIGANEYIVSVTQGLPDFISTVDTPYVWELNIWYHTLNAGYRTRISGETDFPCIYDDKVGLGRSYVRQNSAGATYDDWIHGIREGRAYVSDGKSHLMDFKVDNVVMGEGASELKLDQPKRVHITASVAALLDEKPDESIRSLRYDQKPYWNIERARIASTRRVPVELIVNGQSVAKKEIDADGQTRPIEFDVEIQKSSWVALRVLPSSHTNPIWVITGNKPVRPSRQSLEWCIRAVDQCWQQKQTRIRDTERTEAEKTYEAAKAEYKKRLAEVE